jgi:methyl-accepting chemotaxis protein
LDAQSVMYVALALAALLVSIALAIALLAMRRNMEQLTRRVDETLRQVEMTAEDLRKTNAAVREILSGVEQGGSNVAHFTEGVRALRGPMDVATKVLGHTVSPVLVNLAGGVAGVKAAASHILERFGRKEERK